MFQIDGVLSVEIDTQLSLRDSTRRLHHNLILFPHRRVNGQLRLCKLLVLLHRSAVDELHDDLSRTLRCLSPYGETVFLALMQTDAEETIVAQPGTTLLVTWIA